MISLHVDLTGGHLEYDIEDILKCRNHKQKQKELLVKWQGFYKKKTRWHI